MLFCPSVDRRISGIGTLTTNLPPADALPGIFTFNFCPGTWGLLQKSKDKNDESTFDDILVSLLVFPGLHTVIQRYLPECNHITCLFILRDHD